MLPYQKGDHHPKKHTCTELGGYFHIFETNSNEALANLNLTPTPCFETKPCPLVVLNTSNLPEWGCLSSNPPLVGRHLEHIVALAGTPCCSTLFAGRGGFGRRHLNPRVLRGRGLSHVPGAQRHLRFRGPPRARHEEPQGLSSSRSGCLAGRRAGPPQENRGAPVGYSFFFFFFWWFSCSMFRCLSFWRGVSGCWVWGLGSRKKKRQERYCRMMPLLSHGRWAHRDIQKTPTLCRKGLPFEFL